MVAFKLYLKLSFQNPQMHGNDCGRQNYKRVSAGFLSSGYSNSNLGTAGKRILLMEWGYESMTLK